MTISAFQISAIALTKCIAASSAGSAAVQVSTGSEQGMFISNPTTSPVYIAAGSSTIAASFPTTSTPAVGACIPAGLAGPFTLPPQGWLSAATSAGSANIFATPGFGL